MKLSFWKLLPFVTVPVGIWAIWSQPLAAVIGFVAYLVVHLIRKVSGPPDFTIGPSDNLYLRRWWLIPRNPWFNLYLHHFKRSDDDRAMHDHPWWNISILLRGSYIEHLVDTDAVREGPILPGWEQPVVVEKVRRPFLPVFRRAETPHRIELLGDMDPDEGEPSGFVELPVWTLFITGPRVREWGFHCPKGWRHWREFVSVRPGGNETGRGCD